MYIVSDSNIPHPGTVEYVMEGRFVDDGPGATYTRPLTYVYVAHASKEDALAYVLTHDTVFTSDQDNAHDAVEEWFIHSDSGVVMPMHHTLVGFTLRK